jgi:hypothetical protein
MKVDQPKQQKLKKILQRYVIYISDQITVLYLNIETGNRRLNIVDGFLALKTSMSISSDSEKIFDII